MAALIIAPLYALTAAVAFADGAGVAGIVAAVAFLGCLYLYAGTRNGGAS